MNHESCLLRWNGRLRNAHCAYVACVDHLLEFCFHRCLSTVAGIGIRKNLRVNSRGFRTAREDEDEKNVFHRSGSLWLMLALTIAQVTNVAMAETPANEKNGSGFYVEREDGWHWYKDPVVPPPVQEKTEQTVLMDSKNPEEGPHPLSAEWLRVTLPQLRDRAIDSPTRENVSAYYYAQRIMMDKAQNFSDVARDVVTNDPLLDENLRIPFASAAKAAMLKGAGDAKRQILDDLSESAALWFFYDPECSYCDTQIGPINRLVEKHDITIEVISKFGTQVPGLLPEIKVREDKGHFDEFGVNFTPAVMLVSPPKNLWLISQGYTAYDVLVDRIVAAANEYGLVDQHLYYEATPMSRGILTADAEVSPTVDWENPAEWVPVIQEQLAKTYGFEEPHGDDDEK